MLEITEWLGAHPIILTIVTLLAMTLATGLIGYANVLYETKRHRHAWQETYYDLCSDEPGGPRTYHGIRWHCACGKRINGGSCLRRWW